MVVYAAKNINDNGIDLIPKFREEIFYTNDFHFKTRQSL